MHPVVFIYKKNVFILVSRIMAAIILTSAYGAILCITFGASRVVAESAQPDRRFLPWARHLASLRKRNSILFVCCKVSKAKLSSLPPFCIRSKMGHTVLGNNIPLLCIGLNHPHHRDRRFICYAS